MIEGRGRGRHDETGDLSFCAPFKTDTGYAEGSRALMFFPYIRILHKICNVLHVFGMGCDGTLIFLP